MASRVLAELSRILMREKSVANSWVRLMLDLVSLGFRMTHSVVSSDLTLNNTWELSSLQSALIISPLNRPVVAPSAMLMDEKMEEMSILEGDGDSSSRGRRDHEVVLLARSK